MRNFVVGFINCILDVWAGLSWCWRGLLITLIVILALMSSFVPDVGQYEFSQDRFDDLRRLLGI